MSVVVWHDVECGGYAADLPLWEELAEDAAGPVLDLGCGTGRVALHLARRGHRVVGLDRDAALLGAFEERAKGLPAQAMLGDARSFSAGEEFALALAPMQLVQLLGTPAERIACFSCVASHLRRGGKVALAVALAEEVLAGESIDPHDIPPDMREIDGWVYSSLTQRIDVDPERIAIYRRRERVSPAGVLTDGLDEVTLRVLSAEALEQEGRAAGLRIAGRRTIPATEEHVGSTVVLLEAP